MNAWLFGRNAGKKHQRWGGGEVSKENGGDNFGKEE